MLSSVSSCFTYVGVMRRLLRVTVSCWTAFCDNAYFLLKASQSPTQQSCKHVDSCDQPPSLGPPHPPSPQLPPLPCKTLEAYLLAVFGRMLIIAAVIHRYTLRSLARRSSATSWTTSSTRPTASYAMSASSGRAMSALAALRPPRCAHHSCVHSFIHLFSCVIETSPVVGSGMPRMLHTIHVC